MQHLIVESAKRHKRIKDQSRGIVPKLSTMKILKSGERGVWWRTRDTRATFHNRVTVTYEGHPLKSPCFLRS